MEKIGDKTIFGDYITEVVGLQQDKMKKEKILRVYNKNKSLLDHEKINDFLQAILRNKKPNQNIMIRIMTDQGPRTVKKMSEEGIDWQDEEEYLAGTTNENAQPYKDVYFLDIYIDTNFI